MVLADDLFQALHRTVLEGRAIAVETAYSITRHRLRELGIQRRVSRSRVILAGRRRSELSAQRAAHGTTNRWLASRLDESRKFDLEFEANRMAATEAVDAFTQARDQYIETLPGDVLRQLWKMWQTSGQRNVCSVCLDLEGEVVRADKEFSRGPAPVHPECRCSYTLFTE